MEHKNVYQMVTDRIIEQMQQGIIPWHQPWTGGSAMAISYTTRKAYSMLNQFLLGKPGEWLTWNQIQSLRGKVKRGAKSRFCVFCKPVVQDAPVEQIDEEQSGERARFILRWYSVFHIDDTEGIPSKVEPIEANPLLSPIQQAEEVIQAYLSREPSLQFFNQEDSDSAYYSPFRDAVVVPRLAQYKIVEEYYSTTFHELTHSTMHPSRCNRCSENEMSRFGDQNYSREELVAEIGSAMLCNRIGIENEKAFRNSAAYVQSWLRALKNDKKMIVWASKRAEDAARYILEEPDPKLCGVV